MIALQVTWSVTSLSFDVDFVPLSQSMIFFPVSKNAITILSSRFRNCLLTFFPPLLDPLTTNFIPLSQPFDDFVFSPQRSMYSQCCPLKTFLDSIFLVFFTISSTFVLVLGFNFFLSDFFLDLGFLFPLLLFFLPFFADFLVPLRCFFFF